MHLADYYIKVAMFHSQVKPNQTTDYSSILVFFKFTQSDTPRLVESFMKAASSYAREK